MTRIFHYTIREKLDFILQDGFIKQATARVPKGVKCFVWFSTNPDWEETASKTAYAGNQRFMLNKTGTYILSRGLVRIEVAAESAPLSWEDYCEISGESKKALNALRKEAYRIGSSPSDWRCSLDSIPKEKFVAIEYWNGTAWQKEPYEKLPGDRT